MINNYVMSKLNKILVEYAESAGYNHLLMELDPAPTVGGGDPTLAAGTPPPAAPQLGAPAAGDLEKNTEFEGEESKQNYVDAISDMRQMLIIDLGDARDIDPDITQYKITPKSASEVHEKFRTIIESLGSEIEADINPDMDEDKTPEAYDNDSTLPPV